MSAPLPPPTPYPPPSAAVRARSLVTRVLWTAIPFASFGLLAWVPAVHVARRRRTPQAWGWLLGLAVSAVSEIVLVETMPPRLKGLAGGFAIAYIITASVYAWRKCGAEHPGTQAGPYPGYHAGWMPAGYEAGPPTPYPTYTQPYSVFPAAIPVPAPATAPAPASAAANDMAAEIQAELRELRGFLGGEDAR